MTLSITVNGKEHAVDINPNTPLLWVLRDTLLGDEGLEPQTSHLCDGLSSYIDEIKKKITNL